MRRKNTKIIMGYYSGIPDMVRLLKRERSELESQNYDTLGAVAADGMPHSGTPGKPVERMALNAEEKGVWNRLQEIEVRLQILDADGGAIRDCLDAVNGKYKRILSMRYLHRYSWGKIAVRLEAPDSTVRNWHMKALDALGFALDDVPMIEEILGRASRARY